MQRSFDPGPVVAELTELFATASREQLCEIVNDIRYAELKGAADLAQMAERVPHPGIATNLIRHCADEAKHAHYFTQILDKLGGTPHKPERVLYLDHATACLRPPGAPSPEAARRDQTLRLIPMLAIIWALEQRVPLLMEPLMPLLDEASQAQLREILEDERHHLNWVEAQMQEWIDGGYAEAVAAACRAAEEHEARAFDEAMVEVRQRLQQGQAASSGLGKGRR